ncbi:MAG TPA: hypothetical protein VN081_01020 [Dongiaceae bacterium]|nr:hypothetical protein [Dongiaceae bacterium]
MKKQIIRSILVGGGISIVGAGALAVPAVFALPSASTNTTVNAVIAPTISINSSGTVNLAITPTSSGSATSASDTVSVSTNDSAGYALTISSSSGTTTLVNGGNSIAASANTFASPGTLLNNTWGWRIDGAGTFGAGPTSAQTNAASLSGTWAAMPANTSPATVKTTATTATNDTTTVWYGAMADTTKPSGTYAGTVTYTATGN